MTAIWVPEREHEALRDLVRARETAIEDQQRARNRLSRFFLRRGVKKPHGWSSWAQKHLDWLYKQGEALEFAADRETFTDYIHEVVHQAERIERFERAIEAAVANAPEHLGAVIDALAALDQKLERQVGDARVPVYAAFVLRPDVASASEYPGMVDTLSDSRITVSNVIG